MSSGNRASTKKQIQKTKRGDFSIEQVKLSLDEKELTYYVNPKEPSQILVPFKDVGTIHINYVEVESADSGILFFGLPLGRIPVLDIEGIEERTLQAILQRNFSITIGKYGTDGDKNLYLEQSVPIDISCMPKELFVQL